MLGTALLHGPEKALVQVCHGLGLRMDFDPAATVPAAFGCLVGDVEEEWGHGMSAYHNPNPRYAIPVSFFEGFSGRHWFENGQYENLFRAFASDQKF